MMTMLLLPHTPEGSFLLQSYVYYKLSHPFPQVHELISLANKTEADVPII